MTIRRRTFVRLAAAAAAFPAVSRFVWAQANPSQPVRIVVGFAPGSASDMVARLLASSLSGRLGRDVIVDNRPGVGGNLATEAVVNARPDGDTLLMLGPSSAINATLYEKLGFDVRRDIAPVAGVLKSPNVMLVRASVPATTLGEFIAYAKANPGRLAMASAGVGTASHLAGEMFETMTGSEMVHVPYRGGGSAAFAGLIDGKVDVYFPSLASSIELIRAGKLRALAVTTPGRTRSLDLPAVAEFVPGYDATTWFGVGAPRGTPSDVVNRLNAEINAVFAATDVAEWIADWGGAVHAGSPADFGTLIAAETAKWAGLITLSGTASS
jgi:tripartite-type tricarboxylate transporter receptor subunit TctC